jgi:nucleoside-diphosphate-sugar epimerase
VRILVTGGAGYIGSKLVPRLLGLGHEVTVVDSLFFGRSPLEPCLDDERFRLVVADICDEGAVAGVLSGGFDQVIHLAAISNDPSAELDPALTRRVNRDAVAHLMRASKAKGVRRFIYASSASVYGIKDVDAVTEDLELAPITDYARYKAEGEAFLNELVSEDFVGVSVRAATVCGHAPRLRLDLTINILTMHALSQGRIRVFGGSQLRPNIHIEDLVDFYVELTSAPPEVIRGEAFNVSRRNRSVMALARMVQDELGGDVAIDVVPTEDLRSYRLSADKAATRLGFRPKRPLTRAVVELRDAFRSGAIPDPDSTWYRNVRHMQAHPGSFPFEPSDAP